MVFLGFMVNYMLRVNLTFAIVDMVTKFTNVTEETAITEVIVLNRSVRSIPEYLDAYANPDDDDDEKSDYDRNFRKKNFIGDLSKKVVPNVSSANLNRTFANVPKSNGSLPTGFRSFSSGATGKTNGLQSFSGNGGKTQFSPGTGFQSGGSQFSKSGGLQYSGAGSQFSSSGGGFQSSGGGSGSSFQSSGAVQSVGSQGFQASGGGTGQSGSQQGVDFQASGGRTPQDGESDGNELVQSSNDLNPNDKVGSAGVVTDGGDEGTMTASPSESNKEDSVDQEKTNNARILFTNESDKPLPQVGNSKLEPETAAGNAIAINNTKDSDLLRYTIKVSIFCKFIIFITNH